MDHGLLSTGTGTASPHGTENSGPASRSRSPGTRFSESPYLGGGVESEVSPPIQWFGHRWANAAFRYSLIVLLCIHGPETLVREVNRRRRIMEAELLEDEVASPRSITPTEPWDPDEFMEDE